jgi:hypothetical protein
VFATDPVNFGTPAFRLFDAAFISTGIIDPNRLGTGATGAGNLYLADDGTWKAIGGGGGGGDMYKATYDVDNDGVVDSAERTEIIVRNSTGSTLTKGTIVYLSGATGNRPNALRAQAHTEATSSKTIGMVEADIPNNSDGYVATNGTLHNLDTSAFTAGDAVWLSATTAGGITSTVPAEPNHAVFVGYIVRSHPTQGRIVLHIQNGYEFDELHGVLLSSPANNDLVVYETSSALWKNKSISTIFGGTPLVSVPTLAQVTTAGNTTTNAITVGGLTVATNLIYTDTVNGRVGIGTTSPLFPLDVLGTAKFASATSGIIIRDWTAFNTYRAIYKASETPSDVNYLIALDSDVLINSRGSGTDIRFNGAIRARFGNAFSLRVIGSGTTSATVGFEAANSSSTPLFQVRDNGNVLIGTTTDAGYKLDVNGTARVSDTATIAKALNITGTVAITGTGDTYANTFSSNINGTFSGATIATLLVNDAGFSGTGSGILNYAIVAGSSMFSRLRVNSQSTFTDSTAAQLRVQGYNVLTGASGNGSGTLLFTDRSVGTFLGLAATYGGGGSRISIFNQYNDGGTNSTSQIKVNIAGTDIAIFAGSGELAIGKGAALSGASLTTSTSITAASALARGVFFNNTLVAAANNNVLVGLDINPTFTNGAFTGVDNWDLRTRGKVLVGSTSTGNVFPLVVRSTNYPGILLQSGSTGTNHSAGPYDGFAFWINPDVSHAKGLITNYENNGISIYNGTNPAIGLTIFGSTNNVAINTITDAGFKLDVVGADSRFNGVKVGKGNNSIGTNTAIGVNSLGTNTTGFENTSLGLNTLFANTTGNYNTAIASESLRFNTTGSSNTALGQNAMQGNVSGNNNTSIGFLSLRANISGNDNIAIGVNAGNASFPNTTGSNNIFIGNSSTGVSATESNRTWIGK